jgi:hypothetical protein
MCFQRRGEMGEESMFPCAFRVWGSWGGGMGEIEVAMCFQ